MPTPKTRKKSAKLTLFDHLSRLNIVKAAKLLGPEGNKLITEGGKADFDPDAHVRLTKSAFIFLYPGSGEKVRVSLDAGKRDRLRIACNGKECQGVACIHQGAALSCILEDKFTLGLSEEPEEYTPFEGLDEQELIARALVERAERAATEKMRVRAQDRSTPWADYLVQSAESGRTYRVALRGFEPGESFCTCPDFRKNTLGTCKHILHVAAKVRRRFSATRLRRRWVPDRFLVSVAYGEELALRMEAPPEAKLGPKEKRITKAFRDKPLTDPDEAVGLLNAVRKLERLDHEVTICPDAEELFSQILHERRVAVRMAEIRKDPGNHPLRRELLDAELLPYQLDGIAFATGAGRAILADDMGLGKTIQGIGVAEMLRREAGISRVLVICPASLKAQWAAEVRKFSKHSCQIVLGPAAERTAQYSNHEHLFTVCNYEQVLRDIQPIERVPWDLIILDEGQRIKNWEAKTSRMVKGLRSRYALVLSGTPIENRLDDLFSLMEFLDDRRLGPAFRFFHRHRITDERGKVAGYKNLAALRRALAPILLRRTRTSVLGDLPPRTNEVVRIEPTGEQKDYNDQQMQVVSTIVKKPFLTEMDLLRLQKALLMARMNADSTYLVYKEEPSYSSKLARLRELLDQLCAEEDRKIVLFTEWTTMLDLIEQHLDEIGVDYVRLDGKVPQKKRQRLVNRFREDPTCRLFLTTNAGSTGLNLQAANTVINVDLPWNPAVLEQRIGRAHRMGQKRPVHVYILVTEQTIEESMLQTLSAKHELAQAALDPDSDIDTVDLSSGMEELKRRLEVLLGAEPDAPSDESEKARAEDEAERLSGEKRAKVAEAGGQLLSAAFSFLTEMLPDTPADPDTGDEPSAAAGFFRESLRDCLEPGSEENGGKPRLTVTLPSEEALDQLATTLAKLAAMGGKR
jgi:superfamily II DNA or RNA helicase